MRLADAISPPKNLKALKNPAYAEFQGFCLVIVSVVVGQTIWCYERGVKSDRPSFRSKCICQFLRAVLRPASGPRKSINVALHTLSPAVEIAPDNPFASRRMAEGWETTILKQVDIGVTPI